MLGWNNIAVLQKLAQSGEQWKSLRTTLMLSCLQWEVSQAQWSDLRGDYTFGFGYRGCNWSNYKQHSIGQCSLAAH